MNWLDKLKGKIGSPDGHVELVSDGSKSPEFAVAQVREAKGRDGNREHAGGTVLRSAPECSELASRLARDDWALGQKILDDFAVEGTLGEGGMGKVYLLRSRSTASQFAVKRATGFNEAAQRSFLAELQTWIDLPQHPNLVPCRFFRTMGNEILIFAEYVEGGSLLEWIDSRKLYEGGPRQALERMLDLSIQFAWGLCCLHDLGLVHQDVKPGNVLMGADGDIALQGVKPRITDYGLTQTRAAGGETASTYPNRSVLVSTVGGSPAYWSPEQAAGWPLSSKTDIWSWGVSVLEMFTGSVTWTSGLAAEEILEDYLRKDARDKAIPAMPGHLADLLRVCFRQEPSERLASLSEAVSRLKAIYQDSVGAGYTRILKGIERAVSPQTGIKERRSATGAAWPDPRKWLERALRLAGHDPGEAAAMVAQRGATRRGELVADVAAYDEAKRLYMGLVREGRKELEGDLAALCMDKALVHITAADEHGTIQEYDQAIAILERLVNREGNRELANDLALAYMNKAVTVSDLGDKCASVALYDQAIAIRERLVNQEGHHELANDLATAYMNRANAMSDLGDNYGAVALFDQAISILGQLVNQEGRRELAHGLATAYMNKGNVVGVLGDKRGSVTLFDQAIAIRERLVNQEGRNELSNDLARDYLNKATAVYALGENRSAAELFDRTIVIWGRLVNQEGRYELANNLATAYMNKATVASALGDTQGALAIYDQAIAIWEQLVNQEGRRDLANDLAMVYVNKASAASDMGDNRGAASLSERAIAILERLVNKEGRRELANDLVWAYMFKATAVVALGDNRGAAVLNDQAIAILEPLINQEGRRELADDLATAYLNRASTLIALGDNRGAVALYDKAIAIRTWQVNQEGRRELVGDLARIKAFRGETLIILGERVCGFEEMRSAQRILEAEIARTNRADLKQVLRWLQQQLTKHST